MGLIADLELAVLAMARTTLGTTMRTYQPMPGGTGSEAALRRIGGMAPAVLAQWLGGRQVADAQDLRLESTLSVLAVTSDSRGEVARRHGAAATLGSYEAAERLALALHGQVPTGVEDCGAMRLTRITQLFSEPVMALGLSATEIQLAVVHDLGVGDLVSLADFVTFAATYDIDGDGDGDVSDTVTLEQD